MDKIETGRLRGSVRHREAALGLYGQLGDLPRLMTGHGNLGLSYQSLGEFDLAISHHGQHSHRHDSEDDSVANFFPRAVLIEIARHRFRLLRCPLTSRGWLYCMPWWLLR